MCINSNNVWPMTEQYCAQCRSHTHRRGGHNAATTFITDAKSNASAGRVRGASGARGGVRGLQMAWGLFKAPYPALDCVSLPFVFRTRPSTDVRVLRGGFLHLKQTLSLTGLLCFGFVVSFGHLSSELCATLASPGCLSFDSMTESALILVQTALLAPRETRVATVRSFYRCGSFWKVAIACESDSSEPSRIPAGHLS